MIAVQKMILFSATKWNIYFILIFIRHTQVIDVKAIRKTAIV